MDSTFFVKYPEVVAHHPRHHLGVNMAPLIVEDRLLIRTLQTE